MIQHIVHGQRALQLHIELLALMLKLRPVAVQQVPVGHLRKRDADGTDDQQHHHDHNNISDEKAPYD